MKKTGELVLVTGVSGFVGRAVVSGLLDSEKKVAAAVRELPVPQLVAVPEERITWLRVGNIDGKTKWQYCFENVETVIHCAARTNNSIKDPAESLASYREVNVAGTLQLASQASISGVRRFVFISSIKVNGETTSAGQAFTEGDLPAPEDAYGESKAEAEHGLLGLGQQTNMEVVIIRPALVVGPGAKGNFAKMLKWVQSGIPLPLGAVNNLRSLVALENLVSLILLCAEREQSPRAANQIFLAANGEDLSTTTLLRKIAKASGCPSRLVSVSPALLNASATLFGKRRIADRVLGNLQIDATKARQMLGWYPTVSLDEQLAKMFKRGR